MVDLLIGKIVYFDERKKIEHCIAHHMRFK